MARTLKTLGLSLVAVLAFGAVSASVASGATETVASLTTTGNYPATLVGGQSGGNHKFDFGGGLGALECKEVVMHSTLSAASTSATVQSTYNECILNVSGTERPTTITMNGCEFIMTVHQFYSGSGKGTGQGHLVCPEGKAIEVHVFNDAEHTQSRCTYHIAPQTISEGLEFQTMESGGPGEKATMTVIINEAPVTATKTSGSALQCGGATCVAKYKGTSEIVATNEAEEQVGLEGVEGMPKN
jgi:hypothetical protein